MASQASQIITTVWQTLIVEVFSLFWEGLQKLRTFSWRNVLVIVFVTTSILMDALTTYYFLRIDESQILTEGNPFASSAMDLLTVEGYVFGIGGISLIAMLCALAATPKTMMQKILWYGCAVTGCAKILVGSWNLHLIFTHIV